MTNAVLNNQIQLITYVDRLSGGKITDLHNLLNGALAGLFDGVHLLPFYPPIDGEDAGFDPTDHTAVDSRLGDWTDIERLAADYPLMADMIVNHMSAQSPQFLDVLDKGDASPFWPLFLTRDKVFGDTPAAAELAAIYRPRPTPCFSDITLSNGQTVPFWTTFTANQIDIDVSSAAGKAYLQAILDRFTENGVKYIRLDAAGYAIKKAGTRCFMLPETFEFIAALSEQAKARGMLCLVEIHGYHQTQIDIAKRCDMVYDFALPPLVLHTLFSRNADALKHWLDIAPRNCITVLDTHDGIGIVDAADHNGEPGLLTDPELDALVEKIHQNSKGSSKLATGNAANNHQGKSGSAHQLAWLALHCNHCIKGQNTISVSCHNQMLPGMLSNSASKLTNNSGMASKLHQGSQRIFDISASAGLPPNSNTLKKAINNVRPA